MRTNLSRSRRGRPGAASLAAALAVAGSGALSGALAQPLTGADATGPIRLRLLSCCKVTYFGPAVEAWNRRNPSVQIEQEVVPFAQLNDIIEARFRSRDTTVDILVLDPPRTANYAAKRYLLDITASYGSTAQGKVNPESLAGTTWQGKVYGAPVFNSTQVLIYNPDLLAKAGVAPPSIDPGKRTTWQRLEADAQTVRDKAGTPSGVAFSQGQGYYQLQPIIMSAGGESGLTGPNNMTPQVNTEGWKRALTWFGHLFETGVTPRGVPFTQMDGLFTSGKAPYLATTSDRVREFQNQKLAFRVAAFPKFEGGQAYTPCDSFGLAVSPYSKYQKQAVDFLTWISTTPEGGEAAGAESPNVPANLSVRDKINDDMERASPGLEGLARLISYETSTTCVHRPASIGYIALENAFNQADQDIVNGAPVGATLDKMQNQLLTDFSRMR